MSSVILDLDGLSYELLYQTMFFCHRYSLPCAVTDKDVRKVEPIVAMMVDDLVSRRLRWATCDTERHVKELKKLVPWYVDDQEIPAGVPFAHESVNYYNEVYDIFIDELDVLLGKAIPQRTWFTWSILPVRGSIVIQMGRDWRVVEWERLTGYAPAKQVKPARKKKKIKTTIPKIKKTPEKRRTPPTPGPSREKLEAEAKVELALREQQAGEAAVDQQLEAPINRV